VSATTDIVQAATGVAALAVSVLALRESRLQRRATAPPPTVAPGPVSTPDAGSPNRPAPEARPARSDPFAEWSTLRLVAYGVLGGGAYSLVSDVWLRSTMQRMVPAFVILAAAGIALAYVRFGRSHIPWLSWTANLAIGASVAIVMTAFIPPIPPAQSAFGSAIVGAVAVAMLVHDRRRTR
jgi:hypothetical protein